MVSILFALKGKTKENAEVKKEATLKTDLTVSLHVDWTKPGQFSKENAEVKKEATLKTDLALSNQHVRTPSKTQLQFPIGAMPAGY